MSKEDLVRAEINFHEYYLNCGLQSARALPVPIPSMVVPFIEIGDEAMFPFEIRPLILPPNVEPTVGFVLVNCGVEAEPGDSIVGTMAEIVATSSEVMVVDDESGVVVLVLGLCTALFRTIGPAKAELIGEVSDEEAPQPGYGWLGGADFIFRNLCNVEDKCSALKDAGRSFCLSEALRIRLLLCNRPIERRLFLLYFHSLSDRSIYCRRCFEDEGKKTIICDNVANFTRNVTCLNPAGNVFRLVIFEDRNKETLLKNVGVVGPAHAEHSWFEGFTWSFALCLSCTNLLGWRYNPQRRNSRLEPFWGIRTTEFLNSEEANCFFSS